MKDRKSQAQDTARQQREIQAQQDEKDQNKDQKSSSGQDDSVPQTGARHHPTPPFPPQHQAKPGQESRLDPAPQYDAPHYQGSNKLKDMVALITGGDSGIGRSIAVLYAREGANVAIVYLTADEDARETLKAVEAEGAKGLLIRGDVKDSAFCQQAVERCVQEFGKLSILVNNAAFQEHADSLEDLTDERIDETIRTNVHGYMYMARAALKVLPAKGSIINTGSITGLRGSAGLLDYSATKGAIHAFTRALAANVAKRGIRVNAVAPGPVWTPLNPADQPAEKIEKFGEKTDLGRPAQPEEIAPAYVFLAAPCCSSYITGIVLPITGSAGD